MRDSFRDPEEFLKKISILDEIHGSVASVSYTHLTLPTKA